jgi:F-type H+-transporting ATPase subunit b
VGQAALPVHFSHAGQAGCLSYDSEVAMRFGRTLCFLLAGAAFLCLPTRAPTQGHGSKEKEPVKVQVGYFHESKHEEKTLDLSKKADLDKFLSLIRETHIHELELVKPPNPMAIYWDLGLWTIVVFVLLYVILKKNAWGPILQGLQKREDNIREAAEEAKRAREETQRISAEYKAKMDQAYAEIPKLLDQARKDAQHLADDLRAKAQADIQSDRQRSLREIEMTKDQALQEITKYAANLATLISAKAIQRSLTLEDHRAQVDEAVAELGHAEKS